MANLTVYKKFYSFKPHYVFFHDPSIRDEAITFYQSVFGAVVGSVTNDSTELQLPDSTAIVIFHEARPKVNASANRTAVFETDNVNNAITKAIAAGAEILVQNECGPVILKDPFGFNFAWSYRLGHPIVQASSHPPHVPALCSERLSWMTFDDDPHLEPYQLIRNRTCDFLLAGLDERSLKLRKYQLEFDYGTDSKRVTFYTLPFYSSSSLSQLVSEMHRMIRVARWVEIVRCTTPQLDRWIVGSVQSKLMPDYDALFNRLPSYAAPPKRWWEVSKELHSAATQVQVLLSTLLDARKELRVYQGVKDSHEALLMTKDVKDEISFWKCKVSETSKRFQN